MKTEAIIKKIQTIPGGRLFRLRYMSKVRVKAEYEKQGISIVKIVDTTTRTGVKYNKIKSVMLQSKPETYSVKPSNWEWIVKNRIKHNTNTGKDYLVVAPVSKGHNTKVTYVFTDNEGTAVLTKEEIAQYVVDSYWKEEKPAVMNITLDNILLVK